jgi:4-alpha-glucanotransferase
VLWFEREGEGFRPPRTWPVKAAACVSTHDLPTLRGWWEGRDIAEREALGHFTQEVAAGAREARAREKQILLQTLAEAGLLRRDDLDRSDAALPDDVAVAVHAFVAQAPSSLMLAQVDDLVGEADAVNLPGTDRERPNWRRRLARPVGGLSADPLVRRILEAVAAARG